MVRLKLDQPYRWRWPCTMHYKHVNFWCVSNNLACFFSFPAPLSVAFKVPPSTEPLEEPSLTVPRGMEAVVECSLTCGARCPSARVKWLYSDRTEVSTSSTDDVWQDSPVTERLSKLRIKSPSETNVGEYICRASSTGEESTFTSLTIILQA